MTYGLGNRCPPATEKLIPSSKTKGKRAPTATPPESVLASCLALLNPDFPDLGELVALWPALPAKTQRMILKLASTPAAKLDRDFERYKRQLDLDYNFDPEIGP